MWVAALPGGLGCDVGQIRQDWEPAWNLSLAPCSSLPAQCHSDSGQHSNALISSGGTDNTRGCHSVTWWQVTCPTNPSNTPTLHISGLFSYYGRWHEDMGWSCETEATSHWKISSPAEGPGQLALKNKKLGDHYNDSRAESTAISPLHANWSDSLQISLTDLR